MLSALELIYRFKYWSIKCKWTRLIFFIFKKPICELKIYYSIYTYTIIHICSTWIFICNWTKSFPLSLFQFWFISINFLSCTLYGRMSNLACQRRAQFRRTKAWCLETMSLKSIQLSKFNCSNLIKMKTSAVQAIM